MTPQEFVAKWKRSTLSERSASQQHFLDLCELFNHPKPAAADPDGAEFTFERGVHKSGGGNGWADVWKRHFFAWEYKGKHKDLAAAYSQLLRYREDLENPSVLVVCDMDRFEVHTNFPNTIKTVYAFDLDHLTEPKNLAVLRNVFNNPDALEPQQTPRDITEAVANRFATLADGMRDREIPADHAAHFLMKLMFCMFAEDIILLDDKLFTKILNGCRNAPAKLTQKLHTLFGAMSRGGEFGADTIKCFNGGLFADAEVIDLTPEEIDELIAVKGFDWSNIEPSIFGTLFERLLDPDKRSQLGGHFTGKEDILDLLEPVLMAPLRREWADAKKDCDRLYAVLQQAVRRNEPQKITRKLRGAFEKRLTAFANRLAEVRVLDPACGSGNFLYVAIKLLLDLEKEVIAYGANHDVGWFPQVRPHQLIGLEKNPYAQQLAQVVIWIGFLQWMHHNGFQPPNDPVLEPIENIHLVDAILDLSDPDQPRDPQWPDAEFIVGNPPFLGGKLLRRHLGDDYLDALFGVWNERVPREADLCCYWFEKARQQIETRRCFRAGLLATQGIRGGANRAVLRRIKETGDIFFAESDRDWVLDGANVHVSMVGFDDGSQKNRTLDGQPVTQINENLSANADITTAVLLEENLDIAFMGTSKGGAFDIPEHVAFGLLSDPNAHGVPNSDVVVPWVNGKDITSRSRGMWIIDFGVGLAESDAARYESPFEYAREHVKPERQSNARESYRRLWWQHVEARPAARSHVLTLPRYLATTRVSKYRLFVWLTAPTIPDSATFVFASADDVVFGILHSRCHEIWARAQGTQVRERESGFRYTPTSCFETFPFPQRTEQQQAAIADAASELDRLRNNWLNPPAWTREEVLEFPGSVDGPWARYVHDADSNGMGTVLFPRVVAKDETCARQLAAHTLTNLYNQRPTWLDMAHRTLDEAVFDAYGWDPAIDDDNILAGLLELNGQRAGA